MKRLNPLDLPDTNISSEIHTIPKAEFGQGHAYKKLLQNTSLSAKTHVGFGGFINLDIIQFTKPKAALLLDANNRQVEFYNQLFDVIKSSDRESCIDWLLYQCSVGGFDIRDSEELGNRLFYILDNDAELDSNTIFELPKGYIDRGINENHIPVQSNIAGLTWLCDDDAYECIKSYASNNKILSKAVNIFDQESLQKIAAKLKENTEIGTLFMTNLNYFTTHYGGYYDRSKELLSKHNFTEILKNIGASEETAIIDVSLIQTKVTSLKALGASQHQR